MSVYTIELHTLIEGGYDIGLDEYPIFDESYREHLNQVIINRFYFREIGVTPPDRWKFLLNRRMLERMPYYNKMYEALQSDEFTLTGTYAEWIERDRSTTRADEETGNTTTHDESTGTSTSTTNTTTENAVESENTTTSSNTNENTTSSDASSRVLNSTTPQMQLQGSEDYADTITDSNTSSETTGNTTATGTSTANATESSTGEAHATGTGSTSNETDGTAATTRSFDSTGTEAEDVYRHGFDRSPVESLERWRALHLNIDTMICDDLECLFIGLWAAQFSAW